MRSSLWPKRPNVCKKTDAKLLILVIRSPRIPPLLVGEASVPPPLVYISSLVVNIILIIAVKDTLTYTTQGLGLGMDYKKQFLNVPGCSFRPLAFCYCHTGVCIWEEFSHLVSLNVYIKNNWVTPTASTILQHSEVTVALMFILFP